MKVGSPPSNPVFTAAVHFFFFDLERGTKLKARRKYQRHRGVRHPDVALGAGTAEHPGKLSLRLKKPERPEPEDTTQSIIHMASRGLLPARP